MTSIEEGSQLIDETELKNLALQYCELREKQEYQKLESREITTELNLISEKVKEQMELRGMKKIGIRGSNNCILLHEREIQGKLDNNDLLMGCQTYGVSPDVAEKILKYYQDSRKKRSHKKSILTSSSDALIKMRKDLRRAKKGKNVEQDDEERSGF